MERIGEEKELDKLRKTIEELRAKAERSGSFPPSSPNHVFTFPDAKNAATMSHSDSAYASTDSNHWSSGSTFSSGLSSGRHYGALSPGSNPNGKRVSSGSLSSMSSHASHSSVSSSSSGSSADSAEQRKEAKKKRWLPLKSAFSRGGKSSQSEGLQEFNHADDSGCSISPTTTRRILHNPSLVGLAPRANSISYDEIVQIVQEKDRKLTDIRLEALTSQHQLHQLQDQIVQMQHEMQLLRMENERLQEACSRGNDEYVLPSSSRGSTLRKTRVPSELSLFKTTSVVSDQSAPQCGMAFKSTLPQLDCCKLHRLVSPGSDEDGAQIKFVVRSSPAPRSSTPQNPPTHIVIGSVPVPRKTNWSDLDRMTSEIFLEYCRCVDGDCRLGLSTSSIAFYKVGEQTRVPGSLPPDLLPCAFIIGDVNTVEISLKDASCGAIDLMAFSTLIPKDILLSYVNSLMHYKRVMLHGPSGTGKSSLAHSLAHHISARAKRQAVGGSAVYVYDVKQKGEQELHNYLKNVSNQCKALGSGSASSVPRVIIVENAHLVSSLKDLFAPIIDLPDEASCPYVIGTILQGKAPEKIAEEGLDEFTWISCTNSSIHVKDYLARFLRRSVIENVISSQQAGEDDFRSTLRVITWLPLCWHHVNRCLESQSSTDVTIGPRVFTSCPPDFYSSCTWFVQIWNHVIAPYVIAAMKRIRQSHRGDALSTKWTDPAIWVMESFPWNASDMGCDHTLRLKQISEDDLNCPPVPPRTDLAAIKNTASRDLTSSRASLPGHMMSTQNPNSIQRANENSVQHSSNSCNAGAAKADVNAIVWHRQNSPMTSPAKTPISVGNRTSR